ncbi:MAG: hypothetical protein KIT31_43280 [Deltaproteobacteria bacterium]|nr:hypothetical protein [Deltaproteobacteria bacterium]
MKLAALALLALTAAPAPAPAAADPVVVAKVAELPEVPHCGIFAIRAVVRFDVERVVAGTFGAREVYAVVLCPELLAVGEVREVREVRKLKLAPPPPAQEYLDTLKRGAPRFTAVDVTRP